MSSTRRPEETRDEPSGTLAHVLFASEIVAQVVRGRSVECHRPYPRPGRSPGGFFFLFFVTSVKREKLKNKSSSGHSGRGVPRRLRSVKIESVLVRKGLILRDVKLLYLSDHQLCKKKKKKNQTHYFPDIPRVRMYKTLVSG